LIGTQLIFISRHYKANKVNLVNLVLKKLLDHLCSIRILCDAISVFEARRVNHPHLNASSMIFDEVTIDICSLAEGLATPSLFINQLISDIRLDIYHAQVIHQRIYKKGFSRACFAYNYDSFDVL
jgi:hypothetical protein